MSSGTTKSLHDAAIRRGLKVRHIGPHFALETPNGTQAMRGTCSELRAWCRSQPTKTQVESWRNDDDVFKSLRRKARRHGMRLTRRVVGSCQVFELSIDGVRVLESCSQSDILAFVGALR